MSRQERIAQALNEALQPERLEILDESERHHGHSGWRAGGETHYRIKVVAAIFAGKSRLARHRIVNDLLAGEFSAGLHALAVEARAPGEG